MNCNMLAAVICFVAGAVVLVVGSSGLGAVLIALGALFMSLDYMRRKE